MHALPPLFNAIQHRMPIYKHCCLQEIITLGCSLLVVNTLILSVLSVVLLGSVSIGLIGGFPLSFLMTPLAISRLARLKQGKPYGFYQQRCRAYLARCHLYRLPYIVRVGRWSV